MTPTDAKQTKRQLRAQYLAHRQDLGRVQRAVLDRDIQRHVLDWPRLVRCRHVAAYWAVKGEPDLGPLMQRLAARGITTYLPVTGPGRSLSFHAWELGDPLRNNPFGIPEPASGRVIETAKLDLVLMPLVAWDAAGRRLGMGGGYYDKAFQPLLGLDGARRVGVAYSVQQAEQLPEDEWDVRLHAVVTDSGWIACTP